MENKCSDARHPALAIICFLLSAFFLLPTLPSAPTSVGFLLSSFCSAFLPSFICSALPALLGRSALPALLFLLCSMGVLTLFQKNPNIISSLRKFPPFFQKLHPTLYVTSHI